jgi:cell division protein FtsN
LVDGGDGALNYKYYVVVGSFGKQTNAKGLQSTLKAEGNQAIVVVNEKGMYRVLISAYNDYKQAHVRIKEISNRFPDAWVLVHK